MIAEVVAAPVRDVTLAMPFRLRPNTFMRRERHLVGQVPRVLPSASMHRLDPLDAADVLVGLGLQVLVGVVVAAERDVHRHHRRDVGGDQRRRRQRLALARCRP